MCYWTESKIDVIGVLPETISLKGVISSETAMEMAERTRLLFKTDYSVATTGNLGLTAMEDKARGLVYIATSKKGVLQYKKLMLTGGRIQNKADAALQALKFIIEGELK